MRPSIVNIDGAYMIGLDHFPMMTKPFRVRVHMVEEDTESLQFFPDLGQAQNEFNRLVSVYTGKAIENIAKMNIADALLTCYQLTAALSMAKKSSFSLDDIARARLERVSCLLAELLFQYGVDVNES